MGDLIQFVPRPNPDRMSVEDKRALELQEQHAASYDHAPSDMPTQEYIAPERDA